MNCGYCVPSSTFSTLQICKNYTFMTLDFPAHEKFTLLCSLFHILNGDRV